MKSGLMTWTKEGLKDLDSRWCDMCGWGHVIEFKDREGYDFCHRHKEEEIIKFLNQGSLFGKGYFNR